MTRVLSIYIKLILIIFIALAGYVVFIEKIFWKKVSILIFAMILLPHISADYRLIYIFMPLFLFINSAERDKYDMFYVIAFGLLLIPKDYYIFSKAISDSGFSDISIAVVLNILIIIAMMAVIIIDGFLKLHSHGGSFVDVKK
jgi:hypothetical protein